MPAEQTAIPIEETKVSKCCRAEFVRGRDTYWSEKGQDYRNRTTYTCNRCGKLCQTIERCEHYPIPHTVNRSTSGRQYARCGRCQTPYEMA